MRSVQRPISRLLVGWGSFSRRCVAARSCVSTSPEDTRSNGDASPVLPRPIGDNYDPERRDRCRSGRTLAAEHSGGALEVALDIRRDKAQEVAHALVLDRWVPKRQARVDLIRVLPADLAALNVAGSLEVREDPVRRALGDLGSGGELSHGGRRVTRDRKQDVAMVRDERPRSQTGQVAWMSFRNHRITFEAAEARMPFPPQVSHRSQPWTAGFARGLLRFAAGGRPVRRFSVT
jgi:hypothetical protein